MSEIEIQKSFDFSIKSDLSQIVGDLAEITIDQILDNKLLKDIPIVGVFAKLLSIGANIKDKLFLKKILNFLNSIKDVPKEKREEEIKKIDEDKNYKIKVGENLLYIIDSSRNHENSEKVGFLFKAFLKGKISYDDFMEASNVIEKIDNKRFEYFLEMNGFIKFSDLKYFLNTGLVYIDYSKIDIDFKLKDHFSSRSDASNYEIKIKDNNYTFITNAGLTVLEVFKEIKK